MSEGTGQEYLRRRVEELETLLLRERQASKQRWESEKLYRTLVETSPDGIIFSGVGANIIKVNQQAAVMFGNDDPDFFTGKNAIDCIVPEDRTRAREDFVKLVQDGCNRNVRYSILKKDGSSMPIEVNVSVVVNGEGKPKALVGVCRDITGRMLAEKALLESEKRLRLITDNMLDTIILCDSDLVFQYASPAFERMSGIPCSEVLGRGIMERIHPDDLPGVKAVLEEAISTKTGGRVTHRFQVAGGQYLWFESVGRPLFDRDGSFSGAVIATREITERKQMEKEMASLDRFNLVGQMAAGIGHEIRNPMTTVRGLLQVLKGKRGCDGYAEYFDIMIEELDRANSIITEFLTIARNKPVDLRLNNLNSILRQLSPLIVADAASSGKNISFELNDIPDLQLNEKEIRQLVLNLVRNGLEAMEKDLSLTIRTYLAVDKVVLEVEDQGKGIEPGLINKIGTPFFSTKESGTGLGLAVCHGVVARHGALINVESGTSGTTFSVHFKIGG